MAFYFVHVPTMTIYDYFQLKALPEFNDPNDTPGWPSDGFLSGLYELLLPFDIYRVLDTAKPEASQLYKVVEKGTPSVVLASGGEYYEWNWVERNMTQPELDVFNADRKAEVDFQRSERYRAEADPIFFMSQRGETTEQEWLDKIAEIKSDLPNPAIITLP